MRASVGKFLVRRRRPLIFLAVAGFHLGALLIIRFALPPAPPREEPDYRILKLVDVEEYVPPPPPPPQARVIARQEQPAAAEEVVVTEEPVVEVEDAPPDAPVAEPQVEREPEFLPQHRVSEIPVIPTKEILEKIQYPPIALKQRIQGVVYLELFIDQTGTIRRIEVLRDPGYGFAEAAVAALEGMRCSPALANGVPVAVRFRYPVRFALR